MSHDYRTEPVPFAYDGRELSEFDGDPMRLSAERVRARFGGALPRDVSLALNDSYRRGLRAGREEAKREILARLSLEAS